MITIPAYDSLMRRYESQMVDRYVQEALPTSKIESAFTKKEMSSFAQLTPWVCAIDPGSLVLMVFIDKIKNNRKDDNRCCVLKRII